MNDPIELVGSLGQDRLAPEGVMTQFTQWWSAHDPLAHQLLTELALRAKDDPVSMDVLISLLHEHGIVRATVRSMLINNDDVDDVEQSTMATVALKVDQFDGRSRFTTWLHPVVQNEAKMFLRARSRRPSLSASEPMTAPFLQHLSTLVANRDLIDTALSQLPESFRRPLELRELDGLSYEEIATLLDVELGTVRSRLSRARAMLAAQLHDALQEN
jgi:RNA polymerase sigma-70 factor, ECF subfamily